jgi:hypothetical protein
MARCKPGDVVIVIAHDNMKNKVLVGAMGKVIRSYSFDEHPHLTGKIISPGPYWVVDIPAAPKLNPISFGRSKIAGVPDCCLQPINPPTAQTTTQTEHEKELS